MNRIQENFNVTLIENIERVTNMRIEYLNWTQRKILWYALIENIRTGYRYQSTNWTQSPVD
jgi:hypothetical protein